MISAVDKAEQKALKEIRKIPQDSDVITTAAFEKAKRDAGRDVCPFGLAFLPCACACYLGRKTITLFAEDATSITVFTRNVANFCKFQIECEYFFRFLAGSDLDIARQWQVCAIDIKHSDCNFSYWRRDIRFLFAQADRSR